MIKQSVASNWGRLATVILCSAIMTACGGSGGGTGATAGAPSSSAGSGGAGGSGGGGGGAVTPAATAAATAALPAAVGASLSSMLRLYDVAMDGKGGFFQWGALPSAGALEAIVSDGMTSGSSPVYTLASGYTGFETSIVPELLKSPTNAFRCDGSTAVAYGQAGTRQIALTKTATAKGLQTGDVLTLSFVQCQINGLVYDGAVQVSVIAGDLTAEASAPTFKVAYDSFSISDPLAAGAGVLKKRLWAGDVQVVRTASSLALTGASFAYTATDSTAAVLDYLRGDTYTIALTYTGAGAGYTVSGKGRFYSDASTYLDVVTPGGAFPIFTGTLSSPAPVVSNTSLLTALAVAPTAGLLDGTGASSNKAKLLLENSGGTDRLTIYVNDGFNTTYTGASLATYWCGTIQKRTGC